VLEATMGCIPCDICHYEIKARKLCLMLGLELIEDAAKYDDWLVVSITIHRAKFPFDFFQSQQNIVLQQKMKMDEPLIRTSQFYSDSRFWLTSQWLVTEAGSLVKKKNKNKK